MYVTMYLLHMYVNVAFVASHYTFCKWVLLHAYVYCTNIFPPVYLDEAYSLHAACKHVTCKYMTGIQCSTCVLLRTCDCKFKNEAIAEQYHMYVCNCYLLFKL